MPGEIEHDHGPVAVRGVHPADTIGNGCERNAHTVYTHSAQQPEVVCRHATELGQHASELLRVVLRELQDRLAVGAPVVADDDGVSVRGRPDSLCADQRDHQSEVASPAAMHPGHGTTFSTSADKTTTEGMVTTGPARSVAGPAAPISRRRASTGIASMGR